MEDANRELLKDSTGYDSPLFGVDYIQTVERIQNHE